jgi:hypothetical protein
MRPICINHGCNSGVMPMKGSIHDDNPRWRVHCGHCQAASYGKWPHREGVTPFKTGKCSNADGHLGFNCSINWKKIPSWAKGMTEVDHIDGNCTNNKLKNLDELCPICHKLKGQQSGDFNNTRHRSPRTTVRYKGNTRVKARNQFEALFVI